MYNGLTVPILLLKHNGEKYSPVSSVMPGYGPFLEMDAAIAELTSEFRGIENVPVGYTFCLIENDKPVEYWFTEAGNPESIEKKVIVSSSDSSSNEVWEKSGLGYKIKNSTNNVEEGNYAVAIGLQNEASGDQSFASGGGNRVTGNFAAVFGYYNVASGEGSFGSGIFTKAEGNYSHTEGSNSKAIGNFSHAEGESTEASGKYSHAEGLGTKTMNDGEHACGKFNISRDSGHKQVFSVGIGTSNNARKNAIELNGLGDVFIVGIGNFSGVEEIRKHSLQEVITELAIANALYIKFTSLYDFMISSLRTAIENYGVQTIINQYNELRARSAVPISANLIHPRIVFENQNGNSKIFYLQSINRNLDIVGSPTVYIFQSGNMELSLDTAGNVQIQTV